MSSTPSSYYTARSDTINTTDTVTNESGYLPMVYRVNRSAIPINTTIPLRPESLKLSTASSDTIVDDGNPVASFEASDSTYETIWANPSLQSMTESEFEAYEFERNLRQWSGGNHRAAKFETTTEEESSVQDDSRGSSNNISSPDMIGTTRFEDTSKAVFRQTNLADSSYASGSPNLEEAIQSLRRRGFSVNMHIPHVTHNSLASDDDNENVDEDAHEEEKVATTFQFSGRVPKGPPGRTPAPVWMSRLPVAINRNTGGKTALEEQVKPESNKNPKAMVSFKDAKQ